MISVSWRGFSRRLQGGVYNLRFHKILDRIFGAIFYVHSIPNLNIAE
jgi:hypothetical protein